jgi:hypothetical protein
MLPSAPPSLKAEWLNRLVVTIGTVTPVSARASLSVDLLGPFGVGGLERQQVVVVEGEAACADLGELSIASTTSSLIFASWIDPSWQGGQGSPRFRGSAV